MLHEEGKTVVCPYNPAHLIRQKRMQFHLIKCRKNYPTQDYAVCSLDTTHHIPRQELEFHMEMCPKRYVVDRALLEQKTEKSNVAPPLPKEVVESLLPEAEESWDDIEVPTYVPDLSTKFVFRTLKNAPRAEKREFQRAERLRLLNLQEKEKKNGPINEEPRPKIGLDGDPVRMPKNQSQALAVSKQNMRSN